MAERGQALDLRVRVAALLDRVNVMCIQGTNAAADQAAESAVRLALECGGAQLLPAGTVVQSSFHRASHS
jgi:hypothetical protein